MKANNHQYINVVKVLIIAIMLLVQLFILYLFLIIFDEIGKYSYVVLEVISIIIALRILGSNKKYIYKLSWTVFLVIIPITAIVFYLLFGDQRFIKKVKNKEAEIGDELSICKIQNHRLEANLSNHRLRTDVKSIYNLSNFPAYQSLENKYFTNGEVYFKDIIEKIANAEKYILMEFYIVANGNLFERICEILIDKVKMGVEVYLIYDKLGSMRRFSRDDELVLKAKGINIVAFNGRLTSLYRFINYRSHRKIVVVDGLYTYTGGNNIADEYINIGSKYGYWKDMGIRVKGAAANSFVYAFFKSWMLITNEKIEISKYLSPEPVYDPHNKKIVVPFTDEPTNDLEIASHNYMRIIANSTDYVYITTPYLIIDEEMVSSLKLAAKSGVDVKIIIPGIADKKFVYEVTMAHCYDLILAGVKIYTYNPGFMHGKTIVSDDHFTTVGSVNFDFRSLLWNYECAIYAYDKEMSQNMKLDFERELEMSTYINDQYLSNRGLATRVLNGILRLIGPLF